MNSIPISDDYPTEPSKLTYYPRCNTPINTELWKRHLRTIEVLIKQADALGLDIVSFELTLLRSQHIAAQWRYEAGG
jgi:hypothetical protein